MTFEQESLFNVVSSRSSLNLVTKNQFAIKSFQSFVYQLNTILPPPPNDLQTDPNLLLISSNFFSFSELSENVPPICISHGFVNPEICAIEIFCPNLSLLFAFCHTLSIPQKRPRFLCG